MKIIFLLLLLFNFHNVYSQLNESTDVIIDPIMPKPEFPGGMDSLYCYIEQNINYSIIDNIKSPGRVYVQFTVDTSGFVKDVIVNPKSLQRLSDLINKHKIKKEFIRVFNSLPKWDPIAENDYKVKVRYIFPFKLPYKDFKCKNLR